MTIPHHWLAAGTWPAGFMTTRRHTIKLALPWPPSANAYYRAYVAGTRPASKLSAKGRAYKSLAASAIAAQDVGYLRGKVRVVIAAYEPDRRRRDIDNLLKPALDAVEAAGVIANDHDIDDLRIFRRGYAKPGRLVVYLREVSP